MFRVTSNAHALTGDGPAVVLRRGIPLEDMEMFQFHPTGLYKLGVLLSEAARGEGGDRSSTRTASASWSATRPRSRTSRRATWSAARSTRRSRRAAAPVRNGDWSYLDLTHLPPEVIEEKLPDITEFARVYLRVEPTKEPVPIQPTAHYAMGGIPTDTDGRWSSGPRRRRSGPLRGRRVRMRRACTARTASARTPCSTSWSSAAAAGAHMAEFAAEGPLPAPPGDPAPAHARPARRRSSTREHGENAADIRTELQDHMFDLAFVVRTEDGLAKMLEILDGLRERYDAGRRSATRAACTTPT